MRSTIEETRNNRKMHCALSQGRFTRRVHCLLLLCDIEVEKGNFVEAKERLTKTLLGYDKVGEVLGAANTLTYLGKIELLRSNLDIAKVIWKVLFSGFGKRNFRLEKQMFHELTLGNLRSYVKRTDGWKFRTCPWLGF